MATFPYSTHNRVKLDDVFIDTSAFGNVADGNATFDLNIPSGMSLQTVYVQGAANNHGVKIQIAPYVAKSHLIVGTNMRMTIPSSATALTSYTLAATSTVAGEYLSVHQNSGALLLPGVTSAYGFKLTVTTTAAAGSGSYYIGAIATKR